MLLIAASAIATFGIWLGLPSYARSEAGDNPPHGVDEKSTYGSRATFEVGGTASADWTSDLFVLDVGPNLGYFVRERWEVSLLVDLIYENARDSDGTRTGTLFTSLLLEPSYHPALSESVAFLGGLGVGGQRRNGQTLFEVAPRVGFNFEVGRNGVLTPAITAPILVGDHDGTGGMKVTAGALFEVGISVAQ